MRNTRQNAESDETTEEMVTKLPQAQVFSDAASFFHLEL